MGALDLEDTRVGVRGATIIRGDIGGELGGVVEEDMVVVEGQEADKGLQESLRRQLKGESVRVLIKWKMGSGLYIGKRVADLSLQYKRELSGTVICFSHMALQDKVSQTDNKEKRTRVRRKE